MQRYILLAIIASLSSVAIAEQKPATTAGTTGKTPAAQKAPVPKENYAFGLDAVNKYTPQIGASNTNGDGTPKGCSTAVEQAQREANAVKNFDFGEFKRNYKK